MPSSSPPQVHQRCNLIRHVPMLSYNVAENNFKTQSTGLQNNVLQHENVWILLLKDLS